MDRNIGFVGKKNWLYWEQNIQPLTMGKSPKNCPFCGCKAEIGMMVISYYVGCTGCPATMSSENSLQEAIDNWDKRVEK